LRLHKAGIPVLQENTMKTPNALLWTAACLMSLAGCNTPESLAKNQSAAHEWLNLQTSSAGIRVEGNWFAEGWGRATLKQSGRQITGTIDTYEVKGVASGRKAYLTTWDSGKCYYAIILSRKSNNVLTGTYTDGPVFLDDPAEQRPIELRRSF
jgi:hypothetical protein